MTEATEGPDRALGDMADPMVLAPNSVHLVRNLQITAMQLSRLADGKANMLLGASSIVFTITITRLRDGGVMLLPLGILAVSALIAAICAILTAMPSVTRPRGRIPDEANILFFGIFTAMPEEEFIARVLPRLRCDEAVYRTMLRDIYQNGQVLQRKKYRLLGYGYRAFLMGLVLAGLATLAILLAA